LRKLSAFAVVLFQLLLSSYFFLQCTKFVVLIEKFSIRKKIRERRSHFPKESANRASLAICQKLFKLAESHQRKTIHCYWPINGEVDTRPFISKAKSVGMEVILPKTLLNGKLDHFPFISEKKMARGRFGTYHPVGAEKYSGPYDLVVVPAVAFDKNCNRLGYGGGYYDTFLRECQALKVGVAYDFQVVPQLPTEQHDVPVNFVISEKEVLEAPR